MSLIEKLLRNSLINQIGMANPDEDLNVEVICLYFSAHWCPPCRILSPLLMQFYKKINEESKRLQVVYCSFDRDEETFLEYFEEMPWLAINFNEEQAISDLGDQLGIYGIPTMIVLDRHFNIIDRDGRQSFSNLNDGVIDKWEELAKEAKLKQQAGEDSAAAPPAVAEAQPQVDLN